ncbi:hypothetical protein QVD17_35273 [Tagetes erecta]|uniref:Uncharacterized protein n=1 Tax=Tagetes erecta TaxID=13708 RepID=A0AAD8JZ17_TARER|nr:hypothetical protein QVD17_35265 [Tagetes erecta]KAK1413499.1 hypothetical protein QVD17_35273 [Tagetes erecta]
MITVCYESYYDDQQLKAGTIIVGKDGKSLEIKESTSPLVIECGIDLVYEDRKIEEEDEDVLGYYKSWNHIIGGDLSPFQLSTGEYILANNQFRRRAKGPYIEYRPFVDQRATYNEGSVAFKALSHKSDGVSHGFITSTNDAQRTHEID